MFTFIKQVRQSHRTHEYAHTLGLEIVKALDKQTDAVGTVTVKVTAVRGNDGLLDITARVVNDQ